MKRFMRENAQKETFVFKDPDIPGEIVDSGDRFTLAVYVGKNAKKVLDLNRPGTIISSRITLTYGALARKAYAARLQYMRTGKWERNVLTSMKVEGIALQNQEDTQEPFLPIQSDVCEDKIPETIRQTWLKQCSPAVTIAPAEPEPPLTIIWSPGPDLDDDGAEIIYDPSNGTISNGDMMVFPK